MQYQTARNWAVSRIADSDRHEVCILDPALLQEHRAWQRNRPWSGDFSIAAWLRFPEGLTEMAQLMLSVRDQERRKSYLIDRCLPNRQTLILLNGIVGLNLTGEVTDMSLYLTGPREDSVWMLDECHVEPRQAAVLQTRQANCELRSQRS